MKQKITRFPIEHATVAIPGYHVPNLEPTGPIGPTGHPGPASPVLTRVKNQTAPNQSTDAFPHLIKLELYQQDWMPGFAAFLDDGSIQENAHPKIGINIQAFMAAVAYKDLDKNDLPYVVAESIMHEFVHVLESWAGVAFNEEKVEELLKKYRKQALAQAKKTKVKKS